MEASGALGEEKKPLLENNIDEDENEYLVRRVWIESKKLWQIAAPAIFNRVGNYSMLVITQVFAGHLGDMELAATSIAMNVILGLDLGIMEFSFYLAYAFYFPFHFFLQSQLKNNIIGWVTLVSLLVHVFLCWLVVVKFKLGVIALVASGNVAWFVLVFGFFVYTVLGGCPYTWTGLSMKAFSDLWEFAKLSAASGVMVCLEVWYDKVLMMMTGNLHNAKTVVEALTICLTINVWELMFPLAFLAATGVRVANELGAGNGEAAKFASAVSVATSIIISVFFCLLIMIFHRQFGYLFTSSELVIEEVNKLSPLLGFTILLNSVQPILSGVAIGAGWQKYVAYIDLGCYYLVGLPLGFLLGFVYQLGVQGLWMGLICGGPALQTLILAWVTVRCDWNMEAERAKLHLSKWGGPNDVPT
ncbi:protein DETOXIFICATION [Trifolium repens]|nr:protein DETOXIFICATION [Trifolium repens]